MKNDLFIRVSLIVVAILLALNLLVQLSKTSSSAYAAGTTQYKVVLYNWQNNASGATATEQILNKYAKEGWEFMMPMGEFIVFKK